MKIFGYEWEDIEKMQTGIPLRIQIKPVEYSDDQEAQDDALLAEHGLEGLRSMGFYGVIDRLQRRSSCGKGDKDGV